MSDIVLITVCFCSRGCFYILLNSVFYLYESYMKCSYDRKYQRKGYIFPRIVVPSTIEIHELNNRVRFNGSLVAKKELYTY